MWRARTAVCVCGGRGLGHRIYKKKEGCVCSIFTTTHTHTDVRGSKAEMEDAAAAVADISEQNRVLEMEIGTLKEEVETLMKEVDRAASKELEYDGYLETYRAGYREMQKRLQALRLKMKTASPADTEAWRKEVLLIIQHTTSVLSTKIMVS